MINVSKTDYNGKMSRNEAKYFTISGYNKFMGEKLNAKITEKELVNFWICR